jgi:PAS domain S-box-containing protein
LHLKIECCAWCSIPPDNISIKDLQGRYIFDNSSHCRFLGATNPTEVVGKTVFDFLPARVATKFHAEDLQVLRSGTALQSEHESVDSAGNQVWMLVTKMPLRDDAGELIGLLSTTRDITARKQAEEPRLLRAVSQRADLCAEELCQQLVKGSSAIRRDKRLCG